MITLTVKQPFASLIVVGIKDIENRTWPTKFRGRVLIHAAKSAEYDGTPSPYAALFLLARFHNILTLEQKEKVIQQSRIRSSIVGSVEIVDCVINHTSIWAEKSVYHGEVVEKVNGEGEIIKPIYNWVLANPIIFPEPIPANGKLSFWDYPNIHSEPEETGGPLFCHCQIPVEKFHQVIISVDNRYLRCCYCGGIWVEKTTP